MFSAYRWQHKFPDNFTKTFDVFHKSLDDTDPEPVQKTCYKLIADAQTKVEHGRLKRIGCQQGAQMWRT